MENLPDNVPPYELKKYCTRRGLDWESGTPSEEKLKQLRIIP